MTVEDIVGAVGGAILIGGILIAMMVVLWDMLGAPFRLLARAPRAARVLMARKPKKDAITQMVEWKSSRRKEENRYFFEEWARIAGARVTGDELAQLTGGPEKVPVNVARMAKGAPVKMFDVDGQEIVYNMSGAAAQASGQKRRSAAKIRSGTYGGFLFERTNKGDRLLQPRTWAVMDKYKHGHHSTCPYECDCPEWARKQP